MDAAPLTFSKEERICGEKSVTALLAGGRYGTEGAFRFCHRAGEGHSRIMVSVPKKMFRRAVKRNLLKRRIREAYRHQKGLLKDTPTDILFIYSSRELLPYAAVFTQIGAILNKISSRHAPQTSIKE